MHPLTRIPGFIIILVIGITTIAYGITLNLDPNWVVILGIMLLIIAILSVTVVR